MLLDSLLKGIYRYSFDLISMYVYMVYHLLTHFVSVMIEDTGTAMFMPKFSLQITWGKINK